ncbi:MAG: transcription termination factor NusA, partial [bacterium]|nr:transcription termination factor NusA [bacterium]
AAAYKKEYGRKGQMVRAKFDKETGEVKISQVKLVVDESMLKSEEEIKKIEEEKEKLLQEEAPKEREEMEFAGEEGEEKEKKVRFNPDKHIMFEEAQKIKSDAVVGEEMEFPLESKEDYGRIAAQTAKQVIIQRIREAEREIIFDEYKEKQGEIISGVIQRIERGNVFVDLGKIIGVLFPEEQPRFERYRISDRLKFYILAVEKSLKGPVIVLSRSHPKLIFKLFELEVPEIAQKIVEIKALAREAGSRSKIAVDSTEEGVDPIGSCVGQKGTRVAAVIGELGGEKIDIIKWSEEPAKFIASALSPAKVKEVEINEKRREAKVYVPEDQLSLAIGKGGQNVRLAAKLTGWRIDVAGAEKILKVEGIKPEELQAEPEASLSQIKTSELEDLEGVGPKVAEAMRAAGFSTVEAVAGLTIDDLQKLEGIGKKTAEKIMESAKKLKG